MSVIINNKVISFICMGHHVPAHTGVRGQGFLPAPLVPWVWL